MGSGLIAGALSALVAVSVVSGGTYARADEGLARISNVSDRDLIAEAKAKPQKKEQKYKTVDEEPAQNDYFKGEPSPLGNDLYLGLGLDFFSSFGLQMRYAYRLLDKGPIDGLNNSLYLEGGFGLTFYGTVGSNSGTTGFDFVVTGRWDFNFTKEVVFFADLGFGYNAVSGVNTSAVKGGGLFPAIGVGAEYYFDPEWAARADLSYQLIGIGVTHRF